MFVWSGLEWQALWIKTIAIIWTRSLMLFLKGWRAPAVVEFSQTLNYFSNYMVFKLAHVSWGLFWSIELVKSSSELFIWTISNNSSCRKTDPIPDVHFTTERQDFWKRWEASCLCTMYRPEPLRSSSCLRLELSWATLGKPLCVIAFPLYVSGYLHRLKFTVNYESTTFQITWNKYRYRQWNTLRVESTQPSEQQFL